MISFTLPTSVVEVADEITEMLQLDVHSFFFAQYEQSLAERRRLQLLASDGRRSFAIPPDFAGDCVPCISFSLPQPVRRRWTQALIQRISAALRHWPTSIIMSLGTQSRSAMPVNVFP